MKENDTELCARRLFEEHSFVVERIAEEDDVRRADYRVKSGSEETILEVTHKKETQFLLDIYAEAKNTGLGTASREVSYSNRIDKIIKDKADQLRQTPGSSTAFRVLWFSAFHEDENFIMDVVSRTAYGLQDLSVFPNFQRMPCFFYNRNTFYTVPDLDGIILVKRTGCRLCINTFSLNSGIFRTTALAKIFPVQTIMDPESLEKTGRAFVLDSDFDRTDQKAKWRRIYEKYGVKTTPFRTNEFRGIMSIPKDYLE